MPKELPGFYFDAEKNRYFPYKGPIPGSSAKPPPSKPLPSEPPKVGNLFQSLKSKQKLLQARELWGNVICSRKKKFNFQSVYQKCHASQPIIWEYDRTKNLANFALGHVVADVSSSHGLMERDILVAIGAKGKMCSFLVGNPGQETDEMSTRKADLVRPLSSDQLPRHKELTRQLYTSCNNSTYLTSDVSCIKLLRKRYLPADTMSKQFLITTLGSENVSGSVYLFDLSGPQDFQDFHGRTSGLGSFYEIASFQQTIWAADCDREGTHAAVGTNRGVMLLNTETGMHSWVLRCKSDVLSLQLEHSGRVAICGLRNGAIMLVDTRQNQRRRADKSSETSMSSSVCCLASLHLWDQYFLASSMDGSIKLFDQRLIQRGPVQSYEGNVNSHTRIELGVDPSEKVVMSGGEDCYMRLWDIKSGKLLFRERFTNSVPSVVCWPRRTAAGVLEWGPGGKDYRNYWQDHSLGAFVGSYDGIYCMDWL